jgi:hypothetical protein
MSAKSLLLLPLLAGTIFAADVVIINADAPGVGFNDPTPATPVGGNFGTTVGQQALNVFEEAARRWGHRLQSSQPILVIATFTPLNCSATSAVLGGAAPNWYIRDVPPAQGGRRLREGTWYPVALAEKLTRQDIVEDPDDPAEIFTLFNSRLGQPGCLTGSGWYYGLDNDQPSNRIDLLAVVLHELGHGLGFTVSPTNANSGIRLSGFPSIWESEMLDTTTGKRWLEMTAQERAASARNDQNLVWAGRNVTNVIPSVMDFRAELSVVSPVMIEPVEAQRASFGPQTRERILGTVVSPNDAGGVSLLDGCEPFPAGSNIEGNILLVNRGNCTFIQKALNAQNAGARALLIANNAPGALTPGGSDSGITIPTYGIPQLLGAQLRQIQPLPTASIQFNPMIRAGTTAGHVRLFAPTNFAQGSSVSHFDVSAVRNLLMEPSISPDIGRGLKNPDDLTWNLLRDLGW